MEKYDIKYEIVLLGEIVGKTCILERYTRGIFREDHSGMWEWIMIPVY